MSKSKFVVILLGIMGWIISYVYFGSYLLNNEWNFAGGWIAAFTANDWATGLLMDLVLMTAMMIALAFEGRQRFGRVWTIAIVASLSLSVSASLAIYLLAQWRTESSHPQDKTL